MSKVFAVFCFFISLSFCSFADQKLRVENLVFINAEFHGSGAENSKYVVKAKESSQIDASKHNLKGIIVDYNMGSSKNHLLFASNKGIFNDDNDTAELYDDITVRFNNAYNLYTEKIYINFATSMIYTENKAEIKGANQTITSDRGFIANVSEKIIDFSGPIVTTMIRR
jgi:hypothetical protein